MAGPGYILVVDDDDDLRFALAMLLRTEGHLVIEAANGQVALDALDSPRAFRLIILDLFMPVMNGRTFLAHKAKGAHAAIPVVIFSSSPTAGLRGHAGVVSVVPKNASIHGLLGALRRAQQPSAPAGGIHG